MIRWIPVALLLAAAALPEARGDDIWARRDRDVAYLFYDYRARKPGDVLTIVVSENTDFQQQESHQLDKETNTNASLNASAKSTAGSVMSRVFAGAVDGGTASQRKLDGKANSTIDRKFSDRMTVVVVGVLPNGNLLIEGYRQRVLNRETRTLLVKGIVRPADIGPYNTILSQYIANFTVSYLGRGPDTYFTNQGWGGRIMNVLWPY
jgi:flagellar L-ring protein precursor FlgH